MRVMMRVALVALAASSLGCGAKHKAVLKQDISAQIHARVPAMAECYKTALERDKTVQGEMELTFLLPLEQVQAQQVQVSSTQIADETLKQCVASKIEGLKVGKPFFRPVKVTYPLSFTPR